MGGLPAEKPCVIRHFTVDIAEIAAEVTSETPVAEPRFLTTDYIAYGRSTS